MFMFYRIQEGMIFVSMSSDELLEKTAQYQIHYSSRNRRGHRSRRQYAQPSQEYMNAYRSPLQAIERSDNPAGDLESGATTNHETVPLLAPPSNIEPQFRVTTENEDNSDVGPHDNQENNDDLPPPRFFYFNEDGELLCPEEGGDESGEGDGGGDGAGEEEETTAFNRGRFDMRRRIRGHRNQHGMHRNRLTAPSRIEPVAGFGGAAGGRPSTSSSETPEVMKPHARFFIEREKSMVNIKFDPPPYVPLLFLSD